MVSLERELAASREALLAKGPWREAATPNHHDDQVLAKGAQGTPTQSHGRGTTRAEDAQGTPTQSRAGESDQERAHMVLYFFFFFITLKPRVE